MTCSGFLSEDYDLYALGILEAEEAEDIRGHLMSGCGTCLQAVQVSQARVAEIALTATAVRPSRALRDRITGSVSRVPANAGWLRFLKFAPVFGFVLAALGVAGGWVAAKRLTRPPDLVVVSKVLPPSLPELPTASPAPAAPPAILLERPRADAGAMAEVARQRETVRQLEASIRQKDAEIAAVENQLSTAREPPSTSALSPSPNGNVAAVQESSQRTIEQLTREVALYRAALARQRQTLDSNNQLAGFLAAPGLKIVPLAATEHGGKSNARVLLTDGGKALLYASNLPTLPQDRVYQLWILRGKGPPVVSAGVFRPGQTRSAVLQVDDARMLASVTGMAITEEPAGGSALPTGQKILIGSAPRS